VEESKERYLLSVFGQIESQVQFGDSKAALLIAGDAILLAISGSVITMVSGCGKAALGVACLVPSVPLALALAAAGLLIASLACAFLAARPAKVHDDPPPELFLLSHIARSEPRDFVRDFQESSSEELADAALTTIHGKARYATAKFRWLRRAVSANLFSLGFMVAAPLTALAIRLLQ
jgi:Pycsar effector protein